MKKKFLSLLLVLFLSIVSFSFCGCDKDLSSYYIGAQTLHSKGYVLGGNEEFKEGELVTLEAKGNTNNQNTTTFLCWMLNNKVVSLDAKYQFTASKETAGNYIAIFNSPYIEYFNLNEFTFTMCMPNELYPTIENVENVDNSINLLNLKIYAGNIENNLTKIYEYETTETTAQYRGTLETADSLTATKEAIYTNPTDIFAFDMQENIYLSVEVVYDYLGKEYVSKTRGKIDAEDDVTVSELKSEELSLIKPLCDEEEINTKTDATITINFARLEIVKQETEQE